MINDQIITPALTGTILPGITRKSVLELGVARQWKMIEKRISIEEIIGAIEDGSCTEVFGTGTAAVIAPIGMLKYQGKEYVLPSQKNSYTQQFYDLITGIQQGQVADEFGWFTGGGKQIDYSN